MIRNTENDFRGDNLLPAAVDCHRTRGVRWQSTAKGSKLAPRDISTVFLCFIYHSRVPKMLKYVKKCQNNRPYLACDATGLSRSLCLLQFKKVSRWVRFTKWCELRRVLDYYFNVHLGVSRWRNGTRPNHVLFLIGSRQQAIKFFIFTFVFTSGWRTLLTAPFIWR